MSIIPSRAARAIPNKETRAKLRALGRRIKGTEHPELARAAVAIRALARGERIDTPHFAECACDHSLRFGTADAFGRFDGWAFARTCAGCEHYPLACDHCLPLTWVAWAIGAGTEGDLSDLDLGLPRVIDYADGTILEDWQAECIRRGREGEHPPEWQRDAEREDHAQRGREHTRQEHMARLARLDRMYDRRDELVREIRFGSDPKKAKRAARTASRKEMNLNILLKRDDP